MEVIFIVPAKELDKRAKGPLRNRTLVIPHLKSRKAPVPRESCWIERSRQVQAAAFSNPMARGKRM